MLTHTQIDMGIVFHNETGPRKMSDEEKAQAEAEWHLVRKTMWPIWKTFLLLSSYAVLMICSYIAGIYFHAPVSEVPADHNHEWSQWGKESWRPEFVAYVQSRQCATCGRAEVTKIKVK